MNSISRIVASIIFLVASVGAQLCFAANVIYTYTGNNFTNIIDNPNVPGTYNTSMRVSGWFELSSALPPNKPLNVNEELIPLSFSFGDGRSVITNANAVRPRAFRVATDAAGNITQWYLLLETIDDHNSIQTRSDGPTVFDQGADLRVDITTVYDDYAYNSFAPGSWTTAGAPPSSGNAWHWPIQNGSRANITQDFAEFNSFCSALNMNADPASSDCITTKGTPGKLTTHHTGFDIGATLGTPVVAAADGTIVLLQRSRARDGTCRNSATPQEKGNCGDHGGGNTIILQHRIGNPNFPLFIYSQYQHLWQDQDPKKPDPTKRAFDADLEEKVKAAVKSGACAPETLGGNILCQRLPNGDYPVPVAGGDPIGFSGSSGFGVWNTFGSHLHFEFKSFPTLGAFRSSTKPFEYGYTFDLPTTRGYIDPSILLDGIEEDARKRVIVEVNVSKKKKHIGPSNEYSSGIDISNPPDVPLTTRFIAIENGPKTEGCSLGWYQIFSLDRDVSLARQPKAYFQPGDLSMQGFNPDAWICKGDGTTEWVSVVRAGNNSVGDVNSDGGIDQQDLCLIQAAIPERRVAGINDVMDLDGDRRITHKDAKIEERLCSPNCAIAKCP